MQINRIFSVMKSQWGRVNRYRSALCWLCGLLLGFCSAQAFRYNAEPIVFAVAQGSVSFIGLAAAVILPAAVSVLGFWLDQRWLADSVAAVSALFFGYSLTLIQLVYGNAGWLVRYLLMFSRCMTMPALMWYWLSGYTHKKMAIFLFIYFSAITLIDYYFVAPFAKTLLS